MLSMFLGTGYLTQTTKKHLYLIFLIRRKGIEDLMNCALKFFFLV